VVKLWFITGWYQQHQWGMSPPVWMAQVMHASPLSLVPVKGVQILNLFGIEFIWYRIYMIPNLFHLNLFDKKT
jgi:hypothetical protein